MANAWMQFINLIPKADSVVGQILSIDADAGFAVLKSIGSGDFVAQMVKGGAEYVNGDWVIVKDGVITTVIPVPTGEVTPGQAKNIAIY